MALQKLLKELGLTIGEQKVYSALLELQVSTVGNIVKTSGISSSKVYIILDKLAEKGFVGHSYKGKIKQFHANNVDSILTYVDKQVAELEALKKEAKETIATLPQNYSDETFVFKGHKAIRNAFMDALSNSNNYLFFGTGYAQEKSFQNFILPITNLALEKIKIRGLLNNAEKSLFQESFEKKNYQVRYLNTWWPSDISVIGNTVLILIWDKKNPVAFIHKSERMAKSYQKFFEKNWKIAKK